MGIHQRIAQFNHHIAGNWQWSLLMTPTDLDYLYYFDFLKKYVVTLVRKRIVSHILIINVGNVIGNKRQTIVN